MKKGQNLNLLIDISLFRFGFRFSPWFCEPIVAGLDSNNDPFLSGMDLIGAPVFTNDYVVAGTCTANLLGTCEALYKPDMNPDELFEVLSQCLLASIDRDALSGWGAIVHIMYACYFFSFYRNCYAFCFL
jgi:20S proteasome subunit beta 3